MMHTQTQDSQRNNEEIETEINEMDRQIRNSKNELLNLQNYQFGVYSFKDSPEKQKEQIKQLVKEQQILKQKASKKILGINAKEKVDNSKINIIKMQLQKQMKSGFIHRKPKNCNDKQKQKTQWYNQIKFGNAHDVNQQSTQRNRIGQHSEKPKITNGFLSFNDDQANNDIGIQLGNNNIQTSSSSQQFMRQLQDDIRNLESRSIQQDGAFRNKQHALGISESKMEQMSQINQLLNIDKHNSLPSLAIKAKNLQNNAHIIEQTNVNNPDIQEMYNLKKQYSIHNNMRAKSVQQLQKQMKNNTEIIKIKSKKQLLSDSKPLLKSSIASHNKSQTSLLDISIAKKQIQNNSIIINKTTSKQPQQMSSQKQLIQEEQSELIPSDQLSKLIDSLIISDIRGIFLSNHYYELCKTSPNDKMEQQKVSFFQKSKQNEKVLEKEEIKSNNMKNMMVDLKNRHVQFVKEQLERDDDFKNNDINLQSQQQNVQPNDRQQTLILQTWIQDALECIFGQEQDTTQDKMVYADEAFNLCMNEVTRQVYAQSRERGEFLRALWGNYFTLLKKYTEFQVQLKKKVLDDYNVMEKTLKKENQRLMDEELKKIVVKEDKVVQDQQDYFRARNRAKFYKNLNVTLQNNIQGQQKTIAMIQKEVTKLKLENAKLTDQQLQLRDQITIRDMRTSNASLEEMQEEIRRVKLQQQLEGGNQGNSQSSQNNSQRQFFNINSEKLNALEKPLSQTSQNEINRIVNVHTDKCIMKYQDVLMNQKGCDVVIKKMKPQTLSLKETSPTKQNNTEKAEENVQILFCTATQLDKKTYFHEFPRSQQNKGIQTDLSLMAAEFDQFMVQKTLTEQINQYRIKNMFVNSETEVPIQKVLNLTAYIQAIINRNEIINVKFRISDYSNKVPRDKNLLFLIDQNKNESSSSMQQSQSSFNTRSRTNTIQSSVVLGNDITVQKQLPTISEAVPTRQQVKNVQNQNQVLKKTQTKPHKQSILLPIAKVIASSQELTNANDSQVSTPLDPHVKQLQQPRLGLDSKKSSFLINPLQSSLIDPKKQSIMINMNEGNNDKAEEQDIIKGKDFEEKDSEQSKNSSDSDELFENLASQNQPNNIKERVTQQPPIQVVQALQKQHSIIEKKQKGKKGKNQINIVEIMENQNNAFKGDLALSVSTMLKILQCESIENASQKAQVLALANLSLKITQFVENTLLPNLYELYQQANIDQFNVLLNSYVALIEQYVPNGSILHTTLVKIHEQNMIVDNLQKSVQEQQEEQDIIDVNVQQSPISQNKKEIQQANEISKDLKDINKSLQIQTMQRKLQNKDKNGKTGKKQSIVLGQLAAKLMEATKIVKMEFFIDLKCEQDCYISNQNGHSAVKIIENLKGAGRQHDFENIFPTNMALAYISQILWERTKSRQNQVIKNTKMSIFTYNFFQSKYGIVDIVEQKFAVFILSCLKNQNIIRINNFCRMLGLLEEEVNFDDIENSLYFESYFYLVNHTLVGDNVPFQDNDARRLVPFMRAKELLTVQRFDKQFNAREYMTINRYMESIREMHQSNPKFGVIDVDIFLNKLIQIFRVLMNRTKSYVISAFNAFNFNGEQIVDVNEFILLMRHIESFRFEQLTLQNVIKLFKSDCDQQINGLLFMSQQKFVHLCITHRFFSLQIQNIFLGIETSGANTFLQNLLNDEGMQNSNEYLKENNQQIQNTALEESDSLRKDKKTMKQIEQSFNQLNDNWENELDLLETIIDQLKPFVKRKEIEFWEDMMIQVDKRILKYKSFESLKQAMIAHIGRPKQGGELTLAEVEQQKQFELIEAQRQSRTSNFLRNTSTSNFLRHTVTSKFSDQILVSDKDNDSQVDQNSMMDQQSARDQNQSQMVFNTGNKQGQASDQISVSQSNGFQIEVDVKEYLMFLANHIKPILITHLVMKNELQRIIDICQLQHHEAVEYQEKEIWQLGLLKNRLNLQGEAQKLDHLV